MAVALSLLAATWLGTARSSTSLQSSLSTPTTTSSSSASLADGFAGETVTVGYLTGSQRLPGDRTYRRPGLTISGALSLAVDEVNRHHPLLGGRRLAFLVAETYGQERESVLQTARLWSRNVSAFIGPQETCVHEAFLATSFNLPMISYVSESYASSPSFYFF